MKGAGFLDAGAFSLGLALGAAHAQPAAGGMATGAQRPSPARAMVPAWLRVLSGLGQWRGSKGGVTREQSQILIIWHDATERTERTEANDEAIRAAYEQRFDQESVMRVESVSCVSF